MSDKPRRDARAIFLAAVENHSPAEWDAYVDEACGTDASLRGLVAALLRAHQDKDSVFDRDVTLLRESLSGFSRIILPEADGDDSPLAVSVDRVTVEEPPDRVGRYRIEGELARGGVGAVYKAHDDDLGRSLAVKMLLHDHRRNPEMLQRFMEEAQINGQLQHSGIVPVHDVGLFAAQKPYFAMKLIKGQTLAKVLEARESPAQDRQRFLVIFEHICETIAYAHSRGVIHRDLKPSNVMIGRFGEVQVVDWGLAKVLAQGGIADEGNAGAETDHTAIATVRSGSTVSDSVVGSVLGTPAYMSPEQARGDIDRLDERSDVFGLGAVLCEILTGMPPYVATTARELLNLAKKGYLEDAWARMGTCGADPEVIELAKRCLAFEPRERPRDAGAVVNEVRQYVESLEERARAMEIRAAKMRMKSMLTITVAIAVLLGAGAVVWLAREREERAAQASAAVASVVSDARTLAAAAAAGDPADEAAWSDARDTIERADALITDEVDEDTLRALASEKTRIEAELRMSGMRSRLEDLRDLPAETTSPRELESMYAAFFRKSLGRDVEEMTSTEAADLIRTTGMREELAQAVGEWALARSQTGEDDQPLVDLSIAADPRPFRLRGYQLLSSPRRIDVERFLSSDDAEHTSPAYLVLFAGELVTRGELDGAETALRWALKKEPGNFRANFDLGRILRRQRRLNEAVHHAFVAKSLRPHSFVAWRSLGQLLEDTRDHDGALEAFTRAASLNPESRSFYTPLRELLEKHDAPEFRRDAFERTVSTLTRLIESESRFHPVAREVLGLAVSRLPPSEAEDYLALAIEGVNATERRDVCAFSFLARVQYRSGHSDQAIRTLEEAALLPVGSSNQDESERARDLLRDYGSSTTSER